MIFEAMFLFLNPHLSPFVPISVSILTINPPLFLHIIIPFFPPFPEPDKPFDRSLPSLFAPLRHGFFFRFPDGFRLLSIPVPLFRLFDLFRKNRGVQCFKVMNKIKGS